MAWYAVQIHDGCGGYARRQFQFQFTEDRRRFRQGKSRVTGLPYATDRAEERLIERKYGINFATASDLTPKEQRLAEYSRHVKSGGERLPAEVVNPVVVKRKSVHDVLRERNIKLSP